MKLKQLLVLLLLAALWMGCDTKTKNKIPSDGRTVLMYMVANNNINAFLLNDINEMEYAWNDNYGGKLYVFLNTLGNKNYLYEIKHDKDMQKINSTIVREYSVDNDACDPNFFRSVINDLINIAPAKSYGLFMSSHGSGWIARGTRSPLKSSTPQATTDNLATQGNYSKLTAPSLTTTTTQGPTAYTIGDGYNKYPTALEMYDIANALKGLDFEYIYLDACHMASIESTYALRHVTKYVIASVAETLVAGAPYQTVTQEMFGDARASSIAMAKRFDEYYSSQQGFMKSGTISVVETNQLENLAAKLKKVVTYEPSVPFASIQQYGRRYTKYNNIFYDLEDFVDQTWSRSKPTEVAEFKQALQNTVIYKAATPILFLTDVETVTIKTHCGLSAYIPVSNQLVTLNTYRTKYEWGNASGLSNMVFNP